ncbi:MAG: lysophospholipid acyltransferase family protein [Kiritimatiellae bacterium]|nr:lysophospholipid acyltransferase family protein [Kiritimatiellia bacterium]MDD4025073.1 lysophospholipid acyltransferase family protein [Kiritimatiellia bacterium]
MRYRPKHILEYIFLRALAALLNALPYRLALASVWPLAFLTFHVVRFRRAETLRRIREVFGHDLPAGQARHIAWISMRNMAFNIVEMMRAPKIDLDWIDRHIPGFSQEIPAVKALIEKHGGAVITVPHMGNWDLAGWACERHGIKMFSVAAKQKNPLVNAWINRQRESGMTVLERGGGTLKKIVKLLRAGNVLAILPDVRVYTPDIEIPFLGGIANFGRGMAMFAITANVPVIPAILWRKGWTRHCFEHLPAIFPDPALDKAQDARRITGEIIARVDTAIRQTPEQWFWYNKRWVLTPVNKQKNAAGNAVVTKGPSIT